MANAVYVVEIDIDKDNTYSHVLSDVTARVLSLEWNNGLTESYQMVAPPARGRLTLDNSDGAFNPEDTGAAYYGLVQRDMLVRVRATSPEAVTLFIGKIAGLKIDVGTLSRQTVSINLRDMLLEVQEAEYMPPLQQDVTTDEVIQAIFDRAVIALPYATSYWVLGVAGSSELGSTTILLDSSNMVDLDTGNTTLAYAGDTFNKSDGTSAMQVIKAMVAAEAGGSAKFFYNGRTGLFEFHNRLKNANAASVSTFLPSNFIEVDYRYSDDITNEIEVSFSPREIGAASSILWQNDEVYRLFPNEKKVIRARYFNPDNDNARIGAMDFQMPTANNNFTATANRSGTGQNLTQQITMAVRYEATEAEIRLRNAGPLSAFVQTVILRGTPIINYKKTSVGASDADSIAAYNRLAKSFNLDAVSDEEFAQNVAANYIAQFSTPSARIASATVLANQTNALMSQALLRGVGDIITITLNIINHDADYEIVGERHQVQPGGEHRHTVTWTLRPVSRQTYWVLGEVGRSELDSTTILAF